MEMSSLNNTVATLYTKPTIASTQGKSQYIMTEIVHEPRGLSTIAALSLKNDSTSMVLRDLSTSNINL